MMPYVSYKLTARNLHGDKQMGLDAVVVARISAFRLITSEYVTAPKTMEGHIDENRISC